MPELNRKMHIFKLNEMIDWSSSNIARKPETLESGFSASLFRPNNALPLLWMNEREVCSNMLGNHHLPAVISAEASACFKYILY